MIQRLMNEYRLSPHTPAPWFSRDRKIWGDMVLEDSTNRLRLTRKIADFATHTFSKHGKEHKNGGSWKEADANARICATAPALLHAAISVLNDDEDAMNNLIEAVKQALSV